MLFPNGMQGWLRSTGIPLKNQNEKTFGVLGMYDDIIKQRVLDAFHENRGEAEAFDDMCIVVIEYNGGEG